MTPDDFVLPGLVSALVLVVVLAAVLVLRSVRAQARRASEELAAARAESEELRARLDALALSIEVAPTRAAVEDDPASYLITAMGEQEPDVADAVQRIEGRLFADIVLRESVVKAAAFGHGVRRALAPETRNRIRFEMRREMKRLRKERKLTVRELRREAAARQRARIAADEAQGRTA